MGDGSAGFIARIVLPACAGLAAAAAGIGLLVRAAGLHHTAIPDPGLPAVECILAEVLLVIAAGCAWLALRSRSRPVPGVPGAGRRTRRVIPAVLAVLAALGFSVLFVMVSTATVVFHSRADRSAYVQARGLRENAVVDRVRTITAQAKSGPRDTAVLTVTVTSPARHGHQAVVYAPRGTSVKPGSAIIVLLDPVQPAYAELPGQPYVPSGQWMQGMLVLAVIGVLAVGAAVVAVAELQGRPIRLRAPRGGLMGAPVR